MKRLAFLMMLCGGFLLVSTAVMAYPTLQLDASGGTWEGGTVFSGDPDFTLYVLLNSKGGLYGDSGNKVDNNTDFILIASWDTAISGPNNIFYIDGAPVTLDTSVATEAAALPPHVEELGQYSSAVTGITINDGTCPKYNTMDDPGGPPAGSGPFYYEEFTIVSSGLDPFVPIHFDVYGVAYTGGIIKAPFSHDVTSTPEPGTMLLLGAGLIGVAAFGRRKLKRRHS